MSSCSDLVTASTASSSTAQTAVKKSSFYPAVPAEGFIRSSTTGSDKHGYPNYSVNDYKRTVRTTAYSDKENEPGAVGNLNAAGTTLKYGNVRSAAADWSLYPLGTLFRIKGLPHTYVVDDYGSALVGTNTIDIYHPSLKLMNKWGTRPAEIEIIKMGDWDRSENLLRGRKKYAHCNKMYHGVVKNKEKCKHYETVKNEQKEEGIPSEI